MANQKVQLAISYVKAQERCVDFSVCCTLPLCGRRSEADVQGSEECHGCEDGDRSHSCTQVPPALMGGRCSRPTSRIVVHGALKVPAPRA